MATITGLTAARMLAIEAASVVDGDVVGDDLILTKHDASTINAGNVRGSRANRNRIINGDFAVNQRGFTSVTTDTAYGFDMWKIFKSGGTLTYSTQAPALGELPESAGAFARLVTAGQAAAGDYSILVQRIESVRTLSGKSAVISFWAKASSGTPKVAVMLAQNFGSGGSPSTQVDTYIGQVTLSTTWVRYSVVASVPSIAGKTLGTDTTNNLGLWLWTSAGSNNAARTGSLGIQNTTIDFWGVQVEEGSTLSPFEQESYGDNLRRCQRYYYRLSGANESVYGINASSLGCEVTAFHPVPMRIGPSMGAFGTTQVVEPGVNAWTITSLSASASYPTRTMGTAAIGTSSLTPSRAALMRPNAGYFEFSAEL